jgi:hypothetical protein
MFKPVWGMNFVFIGNNQVRAFENKNFKESPKFGSSILKIYKELPRSKF